MIGLWSLNLKLKDSDKLPNGKTVKKMFNVKTVYIMPLRIRRKKSPFFSFDMPGHNIKRNNVMVLLSLLRILITCW